MSLPPAPADPIPGETARIARAAFPKGHPCLRLRDELGPLYDDARFAPRFPRGAARPRRPGAWPWSPCRSSPRGSPTARPPTRCATAWPGNTCWGWRSPTRASTAPSSAPSGRLVAGGVEQMLLDALLDRCRAAGLLKPRGKQRRGTRLRVATHALAAVRALNRVECVGETLRHALNTLAAVVPDWLWAQVVPAWYDRYGTRIGTTRQPMSQAELDALAATIGADGLGLLSAAYAPTAPAWLREVPTVRTLRQVWLHNYHAPDVITRELRLRAAPHMPPGTQLFQSPDDLDARFGTKRETEWVGYRVHLTETCDEDAPQLITQVATVPATTNDIEVTGEIRADLPARDLLPAEHLLDAGYVGAQHLVANATTHQVDLVGPALRDTSWQAAANEGVDVTCPGGRTSRSWTQATRGTIRSAGSSSARPIAASAWCACTVPAVPPARGNWRCGRARNTPPCRRRADLRPPRASPRVIGSVRASRARSRKGSRYAACGERGIARAGRWARARGDRGGHQPAAAR